MSAMAQQKRIRARDHVEVKRRAVNGQAPIWKAGVVKETSGKGCFVNVDGHAAWYNWTEVRELQREQPEPRLAAPLTAMARVANLHDFVKPEPPPAAPIAISMEPRGSIETSPVDDRRMPKVAKPHRPTRIGEIFRRVRLARAIKQFRLAELLGATNQKISHIELGEQLPDDELLLKFSEAFDYDLNALEQAREQDRRTLRIGERVLLPSTPVFAAPAAKEPPAMQAPLRPAPPPAPLVDPLAQTFSVATDFVDFLQGLKRLVPCPKEAEKRTAWMTAAEQLWELSQVQA